MLSIDTSAIPAPIIGDPAILEQARLIGIQNQNIDNFVQPLKYIALTGAGIIGLYLLIKFIKSVR